ncbi:cytochrome P450 [Athelia psychrophila]|uniref:Cytochrome P450 n=1 Tax=Athelia psychrophila TaxID=1759441 RepID=A0A166S525_9AGAM|nr:cytochrome P450 [Fibularhizoctonia sp. CBS 109695]
MGSSASIVAATTFILLASAVLFYRLPRTNLTLPPGPPKVPLFGNLFQLRTLRPYPQLLIWAKQFGPVLHLKLGPQDFVSLNLAKVADELLVTHSGNYSGRPEAHVVQDILSNGQRWAFMPYSRKEYKASCHSMCFSWVVSDGLCLKVAKKSLQPILGTGPSKRLRPVQDLESRVLLYDLMKHSDTSLNSGILVARGEDIPHGHWCIPVRRFAASIVMVLNYGKRMHTASNDPTFLKLFEVIANLVKVGLPGNYLADGFTFLRKLPDFLAPWRVAVKKMHEWEIGLYSGFFEEVRAELKKNKDNQSYVGSYLKDRAESGNSDAPGIGITDDGWMRDEYLTYAAGALLEAGTDTTSATMQILMLQLLGHPEVLRKAREEIDREVGPHRMPTFDDESKLPYVVACIKESLRVRPPVPLGVPHSPEVDDIWNGYHIPRGAVVVGNVWAIHMDEARYPEPTKFNPDRFMVEGKPMRWGSGPDSKDRDHYAFGWGRRFCPGSAVAEASIFIALARIIWGLDFQPPINPTTGKELIPDMTDETMFNDGFVVGPRACSVGFRARSDGHEALIRGAFEDAQAGFEVMGLARDEES